MLACVKMSDEVMIDFTRLTEGSLPPLRLTSDAGMPSICTVPGTVYATTFPLVSSPAGIAAMGLTNGPGQALLRFRHGNEVHMIGHKAPGPYLDLAPASPLGHKVDVGFIVLIAEKGLLPAVAPLGDMWGIPGAITPAMRAMVGG
jgi:hypothetical protein